MRKHEHVGNFARDLVAQWKKLVPVERTTEPDEQNFEKSSSRKRPRDALREEAEIEGDYLESWKASSSQSYSPDNRKSTENSQSSSGLTKYLTVMGGEMKERGTTELLQFTLQTMSLPITAMFSPLHHPPALITCLWTITDPWRRTMSPLFPTISLAKAIVTPFRTDWESVKSDTWGKPRGEKAGVRARSTHLPIKKNVRQMPEETRSLL